MKQHFLVAREEDGLTFQVLNTDTMNAYRLVHVPGQGFEVFGHRDNVDEEDMSPGSEGAARMVEIAAFCQGIVDGVIDPASHMTAFPAASNRTLQ
jgi:hypothetical protein